MDYLGKKTLILGDVGRGKTRLTVRLLEEAIELGFAKKITVIDMAPRTFEVDGRKIGGKLSEFTDITKARYLAPDRVEMPRMSARSGEELLNLVEKNRVKIRALLDNCLADMTPIIFVNDISIYLQSGGIEPILFIVRKAKTFIANGYYGETIREKYATGVSETERKLMNILAENVDVVIKL